VRFKVSAISRGLFFVEAHVITLNTRSVFGKIVAINKPPSRGPKDVAFPLKVKDVTYDKYYEAEHEWEIECTLRVC